MPEIRFPTRRTFIKAGATAAAALSVAPPLFAQFGRRPEALPPVLDKRVKELSQRALDAAKSSGAMYADVRLTHTRKRHFDLLNIKDEEALDVGVRVLYNGYWGFAASTVWTADEMVRLGREATRLAKTLASIGKPRTVDLAPAPVIRDQHWETPVKIDPFEIYPLDAQDFLTGLLDFGRRQRYARPQADCQCDALIQDKAFASSAGTYVTQRLRRIRGNWDQSVMKKPENGGGGASVRLGRSAEGWELFNDKPLEELMLAAIENAVKDLELPLKPVDVGRYDCVLAAPVVGDILQQTIGYATQLDRALGYEANGSGTSYINDPTEMLGTYKVGAPILTVTANRNDPRGVNSVAWDDEGVAPEPFTLVKDGVLMGCSTMRESAGWLKDQYAKRQTPFRSGGCADAKTAFDAPSTGVPNLAMQPGTESKGFDDLVSGMPKGVAVLGAMVRMDFQKLNGFGVAGAHEIKDGKRVARLDGAGYLFRSPEFWKSLIAIGGPASAERFDGSVTAVPVIAKDMTIIDAFRRA